MDGVGRIGYGAAAPPDGPAARRAEPEPRGAGAPAAAGNARPTRDRAEISPGWEQAVDWGEMARGALEALKRAYPGVDVTVASPDGEDGLREYAASLGAGAHLVVSAGFLQRMASSAAAFYQGKELLEGLARRLAAGAPAEGAGAYVDEEGVRFWAAARGGARDEETPGYDPEGAELKTLLEMLEQMKKQAERMKKAFKVKVSGSLYNSPAEAFARLAREQSVPGVRSVISSTCQKIYSLKLALMYGEEAEKPKLRAALAALEKVVVRAQGKIRDLNDEADARHRQKRAERERQERRAERIKAELARRRAARRSREHAQITEGQPWFYYPEELMRRPGEPGPEELLPGEGIAPPAGGGAEAAGAEAAAPAGGASGGFAAADVAVGPVVAVTIGE